MYGVVAAFTGQETLLRALFALLRSTFHSNSNDFEWNSQGEVTEEGMEGATVYLDPAGCQCAFPSVSISLSLCRFGAPEETATGSELGFKEIFPRSVNTSLRIARDTTVGPENMPKDVGHPDRPCNPWKTIHEGFLRRRI